MSTFSLYIWVMPFLAFFLQNSTNPDVIPVEFIFENNCPEEPKNWKKPFKRFSEKYDQCLIINSITFNPFVERNSIISLYEDRVRVVEYSCAYGTFPGPKVLKDTVFMLNLDPLVLASSIQNKVKSLENFGYPEVRRYKLNSVMDGIMVSISFCKNGRCTTRNFDNPWSYHKQKRSIKSLKQFIEFDEWADTYFGRDLIAI